MNFMQKFMSNFVPVAQNFGGLYNQKQANNQSFHQVDYVNLGICAVMALLASFSDAPKPPTV